MKKALLFIIAIVSFSFAHAQFKIVPKAGFTYYTVIFSEENSSVKFRPGFLVGAGFDITISDFFSIKPEVVYIQKGFDSEYNDVEQGYGSIYNTMVSLNYIEVPVMFKFTFGNGPRFFVNAGPHVGFGLSGKEKWEEEYYYAGSLDFSDSGETKLKFGDRPENYQGEDSFIDNPLEIGAQAGFGIVIIERIIIEVRVSSSLTNLFDDDPDFPDENFDSKNFGFQFNVAVPLGL